MNLARQLREDDAATKAIWAKRFLDQDIDSDPSKIENGEGVYLQAKCLRSDPIESIDYTFTPKLATLPYWIQGESDLNIYVSFRPYDWEGKNLAHEALSEETETGSLYICIVDYGVEPSGQVHPSEWYSFCESMFPGYREHTFEEREAYSEFIDSFFEEIEL